MHLVISVLELHGLTSLMILTISPQVIACVQQTPQVENVRKGSIAQKDQLNPPPVMEDSIVKVMEKTLSQDRVMLGFIVPVVQEWQDLQMASQEIFVLQEVTAQNRQKFQVFVPYQHSQTTLAMNTKIIAHLAQLALIVKPEDSQNLLAFVQPSSSARRDKVKGVPVLVLRAIIVLKAVQLQSSVSLVTIKTKSKLMPANPVQLGTTVTTVTILATIQFFLVQTASTAQIEPGMTQSLVVQMERMAMVPGLSKLTSV